MLQSTIDFDPFELTIEEKIFRNLKRLGAIFAAGAVTLGVLDMTNIRSVDRAGEFLRDSGAHIIALPGHIGSLPERIRTEINKLSLTPPPITLSLTAEAVAAVPRDEVRPFVLASVSADAALDTKRGAPALTEVSPVAETAIAAVAKLARARRQDAIAAAMTPSASLSAPQPSPVVAASAPAVAAAVNSDLPASLGQRATQTNASASIEPPTSTIAPASVQLAAIHPGVQPDDDIEPAPASLPMASLIPLDMVPMPRPAPGAPPPSPAERLHLEGKDYAKAERCLANAIYFESRSEPVRGQMAVAQVVLNRVFSGFYPKDVCATVYQNANHYLACQFTFACDGKRKLINERGAWARANRIAKQTLNGQIYLPEVGKSTHYHALYVHPNWVREMHRLARYGIHAFYRPIAWGNGADEPVWGRTALAQKK